MKLRLPPVSDESTIRVAFHNPDKANLFGMHEEARLVWPDEHRLLLCALESGAVAEIRTDIEADRRTLEGLRTSGITWLLLTGRTHRQDEVQTIDLHIHSFHPDRVEIEPFVVHVPDELLRDAKERMSEGDRRQLGSGGNIREWMLEDILMPPEPGQRLPRVIIGPPEQKDSEALFVVHGRSSRLAIARVQAEGVAFFQATALGFPGKRRRLRRDLILASGGFALHAKREACLGRCPDGEVLSHKWDTSQSAYQTTWSDYLEQSVAQTLDRLRRIGPIAYSSWDGSGRITVACTDVPGSLRADGDLIEFHEDAEDYASWLAEVSPQTFVDNRSPKPACIGKLLDVDAEQRQLVVEIDPTRPPPQQGYFVVSAAGDWKSTKRRLEAYSKIVHGRNPLRELGQLIVGKPYHLTVQRRIQGLTPEVRRKIFPDNPPTAKQEQAIDMAVNCRDLCLIQGPPGTGKTTVIRAIFERLAQASGEQLAPGMFLITGFQHDAVENAASRLDINSLPPIKFGLRSKDRDTEQTWRDLIGPWRDRLKASTRSEYEVSAYDRFGQRMRDLIMRYRLGPQALDLLLEEIGRLLPEARIHLPATAVIELEQVHHSLQGSICASPELRHIRALRTTIPAWQDDGPARVQSVLGSLGTRLAAEERAILQGVLASPPVSDQDLRDLAILRGRLLRRWRPLASSHRKLEIPAISEAFARIEDALLQHEQNAFDKTQRIAWEFLNRLEDIEDVGQTIKRYTAVYAATCQGCVKEATGGGTVLDNARLDAVGESQGVDTVVIDEAARATPPDLYIPMAEARKRIILVGDHRQLPHLIEDDIVERLESCSDEEAKELRDQRADYLKKSLFQVLWEQAQAQFARDKIPRTVTLDQQFRTHPLLAKFVSDQFYEPHGERYSSPADLDKSHRISAYLGRCIAWHEVQPHGRDDTERKDGKHSTYWLTEAKEVAKLADRLLADAGMTGKSLGIISFYAAQRERIFAELEAYGLAKRTDNKWSLCHDQIGVDKEGGERLRVGTVDAFQGREFDVVLLSLGRNNRNKHAQGRFGHVLSPNRLCVALSRQKRLLIVAGNSRIIDDPVVRDHEDVRPLVDLLALCRSRPQAQGEAVPA